MTNRELYDYRANWYKLLTGTKETKVPFENYFGSFASMPLSRFMDGYEYLDEVYRLSKNSLTPLTFSDMAKMQKQINIYIKQAKIYLNTNNTNNAINNYTLGHLLERAIFKANEEIEPSFNIYKTIVNEKNTAEGIQEAIDRIDADIALYRLNILEYNAALTSMGYDNYASTECGMEADYSNEDFEEYYKAIEKMETKIQTLEEYRERLSSELKDKQEASQKEEKNTTAKPMKSGIKKFLGLFKRNKNQTEDLGDEPED